MMECDRELFKLGVPVKTRHNEVAPGQFEVAPVFESANVASDHQQIVMVMLKRIAEKHGLVCLLHEKPFAGVNGSGKHVNFSFGNSTQGNLLDPGETPHENAQFLVFCGAVIRAVHKYAGLLRAVIATASNDHRLGANEAPPAIISIFLGEQLTDVFEQIQLGRREVVQDEEARWRSASTPSPSCRATRAIATGPAPSPSPATGSSSAPWDPASRSPIRWWRSNTTIAESCDAIATKLEAALAGGKKLNAAIQEVLAEVIQQHGAVVFDGNGYSAEWHAEAEKRGLPNYKTAVDALPVLQQKEVIALFDKYKVLSPRELHSRYETYLEQYNKSVNVEANLTAKMAKTTILPAAMHYQQLLAENAIAVKAAGFTPDTTRAQAGDRPHRQAAGRARRPGVRRRPSRRRATRWRRPSTSAPPCLPAMLKVREAADSLEGVVDDSLWPLPTFQEILFIK